jgi:hypothetical protein
LIPLWAMAILILSYQNILIESYTLAKMIFNTHFKI